ncbi:MAG: hypothetical protein JWQ94_85 [Tardiphaga sp.]|nr:hypothetical protein [Tardiphaga sp.]
MSRSPFAPLTDPLLLTMASLLKADIARGLPWPLDAVAVANGRSLHRAFQDHPIGRALRDGFTIPTEEAK